MGSAGGGGTLGGKHLPGKMGEHRGVWGVGCRGGRTGGADNCLIKPKGTGVSRLVGGGSVKEVLMKSAEMPSFLPAPGKTEGGRGERTREAVKREREEEGESQTEKEQTDPGNSLRREL